MNFSIVVTLLALFVVPPEPAVSELGLNVSAPGLQELSGKVRTREDADCDGVTKDVTACLVREGAEIYWLTDEAHPAHPAVLFRGYVDSDEGLRLEERGWYAGEPGPAIDFFNLARGGELQPQKP